MILYNFLTDIVGGLTPPADLIKPDIRPHLNAITIVIVFVFMVIGAFIIYNEIKIKKTNNNDKKDGKNDEEHE